MKIDKIKFKTPHYPTVSVKDKIVLHFTAGSSVAGATSSWHSVFKKDKYCLGTADIIDRDGTVYEVFDPQFWAYHLGAGISNEKSSVGIEIVNWGPLVKNDSGTFSPVDFSAVHAKRRGVKPIFVPAEEVQETKPYKKITYWHKFTEPQVNAVNLRIKQHCQTFGIPKVIPPPEKLSERTEFDSVWASGFKGVLTHTNFRSDKYDIGPLWDWPRTLKEIK